MQNRAFQSTLLQEERRSFCVKHNKTIYFNPRSYKRSDVLTVENFNITYISIHAPTRGATSVSTFIIWYPKDFNPRSYKRSDKFSTVKTKVGLFQSTLLQEERQFEVLYPNIETLFQSTLLQEERPPIRINFSCSKCYFNPRSYKRSDWPRLCCGITFWHFNPRSYKRSDRFYIII